MDVINKYCAGLDVGKKTVMVCVRVLEEGGKVSKRIREFETMTSDLEDLANWLSAQGVTHVAMESTGVYWKPIFNILEGRFDLLLCNAQHIKNVPGRKTDVKDSEWIAQLLQHGLLRGSFIPRREQRELRDLTRHRAKLIGQKTSVTNRLHKVLEDANVKLASVASDVLGKSGREMIEAILGGHEDPEELAKLARGRMKGKIPKLRRALEGRITEHHRYMLGLTYRQILSLEGFIEEVNEQIRLLTGTNDHVHLLNEDSDPTLPLFPEPPGSEPPEDPPPSTPGHPEAKEEPQSETAPSTNPASPSPPPTACQLQHPPLSFAWAIHLLTTIPGIQLHSAESLVAEIGTDMSQFPTAGHLASWAGISPGNNRSAGKSKSSRTTKGNRWLSSALVQAAWAASRTKGTYFKAQYGRLARRRGGKRAAVAVAHSMLVAIYHMLSRGVPYHELGEDHFDRLQPERAARYHAKRLERLGYQVDIKPADQRGAA